MWKNKVRAVAILGITGLVAGLSAFMTHAANEASVERFGKDKFNVLEIVPDIAYSEIGYLVEGEEPVDLNKIIKKDSLGSIGNLLGDAITVNAEKEAEYKVIENGTIENLIGYDGEDINVKGYYKKVGKGDWSAIYGEGLTTGYIAKSWEKDTTQQYPLKCVYKDSKYEYKKVYETYKNDVFRYDKVKKTYISKREDIKNKVDISEFDYAYIALEGSDGKAEFVLISDVSTDSYREIQDCKIIKGFTYVGNKSGEWNFVQAFDKRLFVYDNKSNTWVYKSEIKNSNTNTYLSLVPANADCGKNTHIKAQAFATLENMTVTKVGYKNNNLLKENVTHKDIDVITRTPETVTVDDIYAANLIYINSGGRSNAGKHEDGTVYGDTRYEQIAKIYLEANPSYKITNEVLYGEKYGDKDEIVSAILQRAIFGTRTIEKDINGLEIIDNPAVVIFDTDIYKSLELNEKANKKTGVAKQGGTGFKNGMYAYTGNDFTKLYICMNMMYPTSYYKNYLQSKNLSSINIKTVSEVNTSTSYQGYGKESQLITRETLLPYDLSGKWGYKDNWLAMSIDNPDLDAEYISEHGVLTFKINNDNFVKSFNKDIIEKTVTTEETFNMQNIDKSSISFAESLNYLVNNQLKSNITKSKLRLLEIEPCESYTSLKWKWRLSGFAPYYMGGLADWYSETDNASYSNYGERSRRLSSKEFIGLSESVADNYDLVYIGGEINTMPNGKSTDNLSSRTDVRYEMHIGDSITVTGNDLMHGDGSKTYITGVSSIQLINANINNGGKLKSDRVWLNVSNNKYIDVNIVNNELNISAKNIGYFMIETKVYVNKWETSTVVFSVFVSDNSKLNITDGETNKTSKDMSITLNTQWEDGYYEIEEPKDNTESITRIRTSEYIEVKSNEVFRLDTADELAVSIIGYDKDKKFIGQYLSMQSGDTISFPNNVKYIMAYIDGNTLPDCGITLINEKQKKFSDIEFNYTDFSRGYSNWYDAKVTTKARLKSDLPYYALTSSTANLKRFVLTNTGDTPGYISVDPNTTYIFKNIFNYYNRSRWFETYISTVKTADMSPDEESTDSFKNHNAFEMSYGFQVTVKSDDHSVKWQTPVGNSDGSYFKYIENDDGSFDIVLRTGPNTKYCMLMAIAQGDYIDSNTFNSLYKNNIEVYYSNECSDIGAHSNVGISVKSDASTEYYEINILDYIDAESLSNMSDIGIEVRAENNTLIKTSDNKLYVQALYANHVDNFIVRIEYYITDSKLGNSEKRHTSTIYIHYNEYKQMREKVVQGYTTYYNDSNMDGLIYTHIGDTYTIKTVGGASNKAMQGAINKDGTPDILNTEYRTQRLSGNDITNKKLAQIEQLLNSGLPVVLSNRLVDVENNKIVGANENTVDNSSNLCLFINKNKDRLLYETQVSTNIFYEAFNNAIVVEYSELPVQYNSNNSSKYIKDNELKFKLKLKSAVKNKTQTYKVKLYIDINCDGNYSESEEMKGLIVQDNSGSSINTNELKTSNSGNEYVIRRALSKEYIGAIVWKLCIIDVNNENIQTSISGCSAVECKKEDRPVINILQIRPLSGAYHENADIYDHYNDNQNYTFSMQSDKGFNELIENINDFDVNIISLKDKNESTGAGYVLGEEDILAYSVQVSAYKDKDYTQYIAESKMNDTINKYMSGEIDYDAFKSIFNVDDNKIKLIDTIIKNGIKQIFKNGTIESKSSTIIPVNSDTEYLRKLVGTTTQLELINNSDICYIEIYVQGLGMHEIDDIDNDVTNYGSEPEVKKFDMIVIGFGQGVASVTRDETLNAVEDYIDSGNSVMLSHDKLLHNYLSIKSSSLLRLREKFGCDRFASNDTAWIPKSNREKIDKTAIGFDDIMFMAHFNTEQYSAGQYNHYSYGTSKGSFTGSFGGSFYGNTCARYAKCINRGQITDYPYTLPSKIKVAYTHYQYWQLDLEDPEIGVWYTMTDNDGIRKFAQNDSRNAYYMYNKGNITYTGVGEWYIGEGITDEKKLFVNTLIQSFKNSAQSSKLVVDDANAQLVGNDVYIYLDEETGTSMADNQKLNFHMQDVNVLSDLSLDVTFADIKPEHQNTEVTTRNFDENTNTIYSDNTGKVYKADTETPLQADENGRLTVNINDSYYIEIPDNIIEWAKTRITDTQNSYTIYARVRMKYYTKAGSTDESNARSIECIQRIIFVKRDLFMLD